MKNILILAEDYPSYNSKSLMYIHTRNICYAENGFHVVTLSFRANNNYCYEGVNVITLNYFKKNQNKYNDYLLICHAANIKHHYMFLKHFGNQFQKIIFFFHGHEVLKVSKAYSKPYKFVRQNKIKTLFRDLYDNYKLSKWRNYYKQNIKKCFFVFVSKWMHDEFVKWVKLDEKFISDRYEITYNGIGHRFEKDKYNKNTIKKYDFITIRANLDWSKYAVDIVNELAKINPEKNFLLIGKGKFFDFNEKASNLEWLNTTLNHDQIVSYLDISNCALMPTRTDAQGLMMCEMASFGIPLITSNIPVCSEVFSGFENVAFIDNDNLSNSNIIKKYENIKNFKNINDKYYCANTSKKEIDIINKFDSME